MPARLEQEPGAPLCFVNPVFDEARSRDIVVIFADDVGLAQARSQGFAVLAQLTPGRPNHLLAAGRSVSDVTCNYADFQ